MVDTSIQMGPQKCVVVLGIKCTDIQHDFCPSLDEVEVLVLRPLYSCPGEIINELLEEAVAVTGTIPVGIISDQGSENKKGALIFTQNHPETVHLYDVSHKINICLKEELSEDPIWLAFKAAATASIQNLKLSSIAHLVPPRQRTKDRMHSAFYLVDWGNRLLQFVNSERSSTLTPTERAKIEWIKQYQFSLPNYLRFKDLCEHGLNLVHELGYFSNVAEEFCVRTEQLTMAEQDQRFMNFRNKIAGILQKEGEKITSGKHYLGSSESLESLFGKFKYIEDCHSSSGLSSLVLAIPALVGKLDEFIVEEALKSITVSDIDEWVKEKMGQTYLSKRRQALIGFAKKEDVEDLDLCDF